MSVCFKHCRYCAVTDCEMRINDGVICDHHKLKPLTNAGQIRAMTDEELAEFIGRDPMYDICPNNCHETPEKDCAECALDWLKQEVKE